MVLDLNNFLDSTYNNVLFIKKSNFSDSKILFEKFKQLINEKKLNIEKKKFIFFSFSKFQLDNLVNIALNLNLNIEDSIFTFDDYIYSKIIEYYKKIPSINKDFKLISITDFKLFLYENIENFNLKDYDLKGNNKKLIDEISNIIYHLKFNGFNLSNFEDVNFEDLNQKIEIFSILSKYELFKKRNNFLDLADIYQKFKYLLELNRDILKNIKLETDFLFIDNIEGASKLHIEILKLLYNKNIFFSYSKNLDFSFKFNFSILEYLKYSFIDLIFIDLKKIGYYKNSDSNSNSKVLITTENLNSQYAYILNKIEELISKKSNNLEIGIGFNNLTSLDFFSNLLKAKDFNFSKNLSFNFFKFDYFNSLINILKIIQDPKKSNIELFTELSRLNISNETLKKISRKSSLNEKSIYVVINSNKYILESENEKKIILNFVKKLNLLIELKNSKINLFDLIFNVVAYFDFYNFNNFNLNKLNFELIFSLNYFLEFSYMFIKKYKKSNLNYFLEKLEIIEKYNLDIIISDKNRFSNYNNLNLENYNIYHLNNKINNENNISINLFLYSDYLNISFDYLFMTDISNQSFIQPVKQLIYKSKFFIIQKDLNIKNYKKIIDFYIGNNKIVNLFYVEYNEFLNKNQFKLDFVNLENSINYSINNNLSLIFSKFKLKNILLNKINKNLISGNFKLTKIYVEMFEYLFSNNKKNSLEKFNFSSNLQEELNLEFKEYNNLLNRNTININDNLKFDLNKFVLFNYDFQKDLKLDMTKQIYSVSQLKTYQSCPQKYLFQYIFKIPTLSKHYFDFGTSIHQVLEYLVDEFDNQLNSKEIIFAKGIELLHKIWISKGYISSIQEREYFEKGVIAIRNFIEKELQLRKNEKNRKIIAKEKTFTLNLRGRKIYGIIDRIDKIGRDFEILDYKTSNSCESQFNLNKSIQLYVYAMALNQLYSKYPKKMGLWYLIFDKIDRIEFNNNNLKKVELEILNLIENIENLNFKPKPSDFACKFCDFRKICKNSLYQ